MATSALFAVIGHMFPVWLRFRGGKGVATALGAFLRFEPCSVLVAIIIFVIVVLFPAAFLWDQSSLPDFFPWWLFSCCHATPGSWHSSAPGPC